MNAYNIINKIIFTIIMLPQNILGAIVWLIFHKTIIEKRQRGPATVYILDAKFTGVSLGLFIFVSTYHHNIDLVIEHEYGHFLQGIKLTWFYLIIVGLPSIVMNIISRFSLKFGSGQFAYDYYKRWPESWADKLVGIER